MHQSLQAVDCDQLPATSLDPSDGKPVSKSDTKIKK